MRRREAEGRRREGGEEEEEGGGGGSGLITRTPYLGYGEKMPNNCQKLQKKFQKNSKKLKREGIPPPLK